METRDLDHLAGVSSKPKELPLVCLQCGYNLTGVPSGRCPECGNPIVRREIDRYLRDMKFKGRELEEANFWLRIAVWMAIFSIVARVLAWLLSSGFTAAGLRIMAVVGGGMAACLGLAIFRIKTLPEWAREYVTATPDYIRGVAAIVLGLIAMVIGIKSW